MAGRKLNYRFHNPNTIEATADELIKVFVQVNMGKVELALQQAANEMSESREREKYPAPE